MDAGVRLGEDAIRLAKAKTYATVVTLMPDGRPQAQLTWVDTDGEHILVNSPASTQRVRNIARDPRVSVLLVSPTDPMDRVEVRGRVIEVVRGASAAKHIDELCHQYLGIPYTEINDSDEERVLLKIAADRVVEPG
ncbi:TIGR03618 family F420-dependent PPOX class oxidoreductase [Streptomyces sp. NPDC002838]|uniref:TIGR03618 family F420-dependent PPOX class oxidoreductase n=1 Tax=Streptomyces sp. NPDC002838 TaxID=3154436 RepID=UPI00332F5548